MAFDIIQCGGLGSADFVLTCDLSFIHKLLFSKAVIKNKVSKQNIVILNVSVKGLSNIPFKSLQTDIPLLLQHAKLHSLKIC